MDGKERVKIDSELYVNEATLELLRRRIESEVKDNFFRWIGLPLGGAGVVAIILTLFIWIPHNIATTIEKNPSIQKMLHDSAVAYLNNPKGQQFISDQIKTDVQEYLEDPNRGQQFIQKQIEETAQDQVKATTVSFLESRGEEVIQELADRHLKSEKVTDLISSLIEKELRPKSAALGQAIDDNLDKLVLKIAEPFREYTRTIDKESVGELLDFLGRDEAEELKRKGTPIALAVTVRQGD